MAVPRAKQSNPISTGGGGNYFEYSVQTYFAMYIIMGAELPFFKGTTVEKMKMQGRYDGYNTDDCILFGKDGRKILFQIKHSISISNSNDNFQSTMKDAWNDYTNSETFNVEKDQIVLVVPSLSSTDSENVITIIDWARSCENEAEFHKKISLKNFSSGEKQKKLEVIKKQLSIAKGSELSDFEVWDFLKHFFIQPLDLIHVDSPLSIASSNLFANIIGKQGLDGDLFKIISSYDNKAATVTRDKLLNDLKIDWPIKANNTINAINSHNDIVLASMHNSINGYNFRREEYVADIADALIENDIVLIAGERGIGKTGVVKNYIGIRDSSAFNLFFRAEELNKPSINGVFSDLLLNVDLESLKQIGTDYLSKCIFIESLERILDNEHQKAFMDLLYFVSCNPGWKIISTVRDYALQQLLMEYFSTTTVKVTSIRIDKLTEQEVSSFFKSHNIANLSGIRKDVFEILRIPVYLDYVYRAINCGYSLENADTEQSIKNAIWDFVIMKSQNRKNALPRRRSKTFIEIAVSRAKQHKHEIPASAYDEEVIQSLQEDNLINIRRNLISITHDVLEDWAVERWIEDCYQSTHDNIGTFFNTIGFEQSICRAYRLWLIEKASEENFIISFYESMLIDTNSEEFSLWEDETIVAILYSDKLNDILCRNKKEILSRPNLCKKICRMISIAAKSPHNVFDDLASSMRSTERASFILLRPTGNCWINYISFLYENREELAPELYSHCKSLMSEWIKTFTIRKDIIDGARETGLLSLFILTKYLNSQHTDEDCIESLIDIAIVCYGSIQNEFDAFVQNVILIKEPQPKEYRIRLIARHIVSSLSCCYIAKYNSELLIKVAKREWLISEQPDELESKEYHFQEDEATYGFNYNYKYDYNNSSAYKEPFRSLFKWNPEKATEFVLELCNNAVSANISYCFPNKSECEIEEELSGITCKIEIDAGTKVAQIAIPEFWCAYRGFTVIPGVLKCALMALENYLLEQSTLENIDIPTFDQLLRNLVMRSNSVMITAVVAAVLISSNKIFKETSLLLLKNREFYSLDLSRLSQEFSSDLFLPLKNGNANLYYNERKKANEYGFRKETLEDLCLRLQLTNLRNSIFDIIDSIDKEYNSDSSWHFCKHRMDIRESSVHYDDKTNTLSLYSKPLEGKDRILQEEQKKKNEWLSRFTKWTDWADQYLTDTTTSLPVSPSDCIVELKSLLQYYATNKDKMGDIYLQGINKTISILVKEHATDLLDEDIDWCIHYIKENLCKLDDSSKDLQFQSYSITGIDYLLSAIPYLYTCITLEEYLSILIEGLTLNDKKMRFPIANSISSYLWSQDLQLSQKCLSIISTFDLLESDYSASHSPINKRKNKGSVTKEKWLRRVRKELSKETVSTQSQLSFLGTSIIIAAIPKTDNHFELVKPLFEKCINNICSVEQMISQRDRASQIDISQFYDFNTNNTNNIGTLLYQLSFKNMDSIKDSINQMALYAPSTCSYVLNRVRDLSDSSHDYKNLWHFWCAMNDSAKTISNMLNEGENYRYRKERDMLIGYMYVNTPWQRTDYINEPVKDGAEHIYEFAKDTIHNPIVYEGMASLMYHFPSTFLLKGILCQAHLSKSDLNRVFSVSPNSAFYMENNIFTYITQAEVSTIPANLYNTCSNILEVLIKRASSKAYYARELLLKSMRIE